MKLEQMDLVEVNEAFAPQYLAVEKELGLDRAKTNVHGGAVAIGHPLAATGTRITIHLLHALRRRRQRFGLGSACIGGGQGAAVDVEGFPAVGGAPGGQYRGPRPRRGGAVPFWGPQRASRVQ